MATERQIQKKRQLKSTPTPTTEMFQSRPFAVQAKPEAGTSPTPETPELQTQTKIGQPKGEILSRLAISSTPSIQPKLTIGAIGTHPLQQSSTLTLQRKSANITPLTRVGSQLIGTSTTEDIQKCIKEYNDIANGDKNFDNQLRILQKLLGYVDKWLSNYSGKKPDKEIEITKVNREALEEKRKVEDARKTAVTAAFNTKNQTQGQNQSTTNTKYEELTNAEIDEIYNPILANIKAEVVNKLGVGRGEFRRSKELNQFRQQLKEAARVQAHQDINNELNLSGQGNTAMAKYQAMKADLEAYSTAKGSVNKVMESKAQEIAQNFAKKDDYKNELNRVAATAANSEAIKFISTDQDLSKPKTTQAIKTAKLNAAILKAKLLHSTHLDQAIREAKQITKGQQTNQALAQNDTSLLGKVKTQVTSDQVGKTAVQKVIEADTLTQGFDKIASLIDLNAPTAGTSVSLTIELRIKDPNTGGYFISQFIGEAEKEQEEADEPLEVSLRAEFSLGGGWERFGLDVNGQLGFFFESTAVNSKKAVGLISYGLYRNLQTKNLDSNVANVIWGYGGKSQLKDKGKEAETWASAMEEYLFTRTNAQGNKILDQTSQVELGTLLKGKAKANLGFATGELEGKLSHAKKYSAKSMGMDTIDKVGKTKDKNSAELTQAIAGKGVSYIEVKGAMEAMKEFAGGEIEVKFGWDGRTFKSMEIEGTGSLSSAIGKGGDDYGEVMNHVCKAIASYVNSLVAISKKAYNIATKKAKTTPEQVGECAGILSDISMMAITIGDQTGKEWGKKVVGVAGDEVVQDMINSTASEASMNPVFDIKQQLKIGSSFSWESGDDKKFKIFLSQVKGLTADTGSLLGQVFRLKIEGETTNNLVGKTWKW